jgi:hypothetical protein
MTDKATRKGAEQTEQTPEQTTENISEERTGRQAVIEAMVTKRRAENPPETDDEPAEEPAPPEDLVTIKVDGQEQRVPRDKVYEFGVRALQKEIAADARLADAANMKRQVEQQSYAVQQREAEINALAAQLMQRDKETGIHPALGDAERRKDAEKLLDAVYDGEKETAIDQLVRFSEGRGNVTPEDVQRMMAEATRQARIEVHKEIQAEKWNTELTEAREWFETERADIATDPQWRALADRETADLLRQHPDWLPKKIVKAAVQRVEELRQSFKAQTPGKRELKQQIDVPRTASGRLPAPKEPAPRTNSQYIQDLRRSRGLER